MGGHPAPPHPFILQKCVYQVKVVKFEIRKKKGPGLYKLSKERAVFCFNNIIKRSTISWPANKHGGHLSLWLHLPGLGDFKLVKIHTKTPGNS